MLSCILDSGAYSAWRRQDVVDLDAYIAFVKEHQDNFCSIVALDKIPGEKGRMPETKKEIEEAAAQSHKNFVVMRKGGIDAIPVFHQGEDFKWLECMLNDEVPYIGISPYLNAASDSMLRWLDHVFTRLTDADGKPLCKTHGFGVTSHRIVRRYPWFSVDSTTWALAAAFGNVLLPRFRTSGADYSRPQVFKVSEREIAPQLAPWYRKSFDDYFESLGLSFAEVRLFHKARLRVNASFFLGVQAQLRAARFRRRLAHLEPRENGKHSAAFEYAPKIFFATMLKSQQQAVVLTQLKAQHRLISYYDCHKYDARQINDYARNGISETRPAFRWR